MRWRYEDDWLREEWLQDRAGTGRDNVVRELGERTAADDAIERWWR